VEHGNIPVRGMVAGSNPARSAILILMKRVVLLSHQPIIVSWNSFDIDVKPTVQERHWTLSFEHE
jgi:hypothetical protein